MPLSQDASLVTQFRRVNANSIATPPKRSSYSFYSTRDGFLSSILRASLEGKRISPGTSVLTQKGGTPPPPQPPADAIAASLTTSLASYNAASIGSWVKITGAEYANLKTNVANTSVSGTTDSRFSDIVAAYVQQIIGGNQFFVLSNYVTTDTPSVPPNSYVYAFSFYQKFFPDIVSSTYNCYAYLGDTPNTGNHLNQIGTTSITNLSDGLNYFVLKGSTIKTGQSGGDLGFGCNAYTIAGKNYGTGGFYFNRNDNPPPSPLDDNLNNWQIAYQGLSTTTKQW